MSFHLWIFHCKSYPYLDTVYIYLPYFLGLNTIRRHKKNVGTSSVYYSYTLLLLLSLCKKTITYAHFIVHPHLSLTTVCFFFVCKYYIVQYILQERKKFFGELWQLLDILSCVLRWVIKIGGILRVAEEDWEWAELWGIPFIPSIHYSLCCFFK